VSGLRSIVEELRGETLAEVPDALVEDDFVELQRAFEQLEAERLRRHWPSSIVGGSSSATAICLWPPGS
jgi:hypothetical protein